MKPIRWEYCLQILGVSYIEGKNDGDEDWKRAVEYLNEAGAEGWEAVGVVVSRQKASDGDDPEPTVLMKRPIRGED